MEEQTSLIKKVDLKAVDYLLKMIYNGLKNNDRDCVYSHLEDLNLYISEKLGER